MSGPPDIRIKVQRGGMLLPALLLLILLVTGCVKEPGIGGRAEIHGRVIEQHHNNSGQPRGDPYPRAGRRVYISYGDATGHDDDVRTGPDGRFRFAWLRKGTYRVFTFSECHHTDPLCIGGTKVVTRTVEITDRRELVDIGDMLIENW
jgi:hypothetical protein